MTWDEYYDKVWDWSISTAVNRLSSLENLGDSTEVAELIGHLGFDDKKALDVSAKKFKKADLEELYGLIDDEMLLEIANKYNIPLPSDFEDVHEITNEKVSTPIAWKKFYDEYCFWDDERGASTFVKNMLEKGIIFSADALVEISCLCNASTLEKAVMQSSGRFISDDMDTLCGCIPDALIKKVAKNRHLPLPEYLCENPPVKQKFAREERGYVYSKSECLAMGLHPDDKLYKLYLRFKVLMGDKW